MRTRKANGAIAVPITRFKIQGIKALHYAECTDVPKLMVITGPNGVGKSTLLHALKQRYGEQVGSGQILYVGPHRAWRRQSLRTMFLHGRDVDYRQLLSMEQLARIDGLTIGNHQRTPDSVDEAQSMIKFSLAQIEVRRQAAITTLYDKGRAEPSYVDVYKPLRTMVDILLPHLKFDRVSFDNKDDVRCLFARADSESHPAVDIDDLSSGEKATIALLLPLLEAEINVELGKLSGSIAEDAGEVVCIIDEPELHLHPILQEKLLDYFRQVAEGGKAQFIISTHSPVIINSATVDELFLMTAGLGAAHNQLVPAVSEMSRIEAVRSLAGDTYRLTSGRPLVLVEGANPRESKDEPSDVRLVEMLSPAFRRYALLSLGDKERIRQLAGALDQLLVPGYGSQAFAITDMDQALPSAGSADRVFRWPVAMIENFLLSPDGMYAVLEPYREQTGVNSGRQVLQLLREIADHQRTEEVRLRVAERMRPFRWHFQGRSVDELMDNCNKAKVSLENVISRDVVQSAFSEAEAEVAEIVRSGRELEFFHGKTILKTFFGRVGKRTGLTYKSFCIEIARHLGRVSEPSGMAAIRHQIDTYIPTRLKDVLIELRGFPGTGPVQALVPRLEEALEARSNGTVSDQHTLKTELLRTLHDVAVSSTDRGVISRIEEAYGLAHSIRVPL